jgi:hypothetical protein
LARIDEISFSAQFNNTFLTKLFQYSMVNRKKRYGIEIRLAITGLGHIERPGVQIQPLTVGPVHNGRWDVAPTAKDPIFL